MLDLLEPQSTRETSPKTSTRTQLARAALKLIEVIPRSPRSIVEKPRPVDLPDTGTHHIKDPEKDLTVGKLQEAKWKEEFDALLPTTPEDQKQRLYERAMYDPTVLVAPEPQLKSRVITFPSKDEHLLKSVHKNKQP